MQVQTLNRKLKITFKADKVQEILAWKEIVILRRQLSWELCLIK